MRGHSLLLAVHRAGVAETLCFPECECDPAPRRLVPWKTNKLTDEVFQGEYNMYGERHGKGILVTPEMLTLGTWKRNEL